MSGFDQQTVHDLEFQEIRNWLMNFAIGSSAKQRLENLSPSNDFDAIEIELMRLNEFKQIRTIGESFPALDFEELQTELKLLPVSNAVLPQEGFVRITRASELVNSIVVFFNKRTQDYPYLFKL